MEKNVSLKTVINGYVHVKCYESGSFFSSYHPVRYYERMLLNNPILKAS